MHIDLTGKTVLVTGASRGIGRGLAEGLAGAGASVAVHYGQSQAAADELVASLGNGSRAFQADLADPQACQRLFADIVEAYGRVDAVVNNAGIALSIPFDGVGEEWLDAWNLSLIHI